MPRSYPDEPLAVGDVLSYRCQDCGDRWDLVVEEDDLDPD
jgi:predicted nucleic acid-binding Zn ribbon protein